MGRQIDPKNVVGRDQLIASIWNNLKQGPTKGSLRFTAERRVGKTTVMPKMAAEPPADFDVLYLEVEGIDSCDRLAELLLNRMRPLLTNTETARTWFELFWKNLHGTEIRGVIKLPERSDLGWQQTIEKCIEGFCRNRAERYVLLMFDELPYMLQKIEQVSTKCGRSFEALTLLDTLRALRQRHANLRMIFAGSVGLHHVLRDLRQSTLAAEPINNMPLVQIHPLDDQYAVLLACKLMESDNVILADDRISIAERLSEHASNVPFYMERIVSQLALLGRPIKLADVDMQVLEQLANDQDPWEMEHFRSRLEIYYGRSLLDDNGKSIQEARIARSVLDLFAEADEPQSIDEVWAIIRSQFSLTDRNIAVQLLKSLAQDHYLMSDSTKRYTFRFPLIKRWWKLAQGLGS